MTQKEPDVSVRLLKSIRFTGIAEVEYKWDAAHEEFRLIEVNPRPWDQHRLGRATGNDLIYLAYCEHAEREMPVSRAPDATAAHSVKWVAEDSLWFAVLRIFRRRDPRLRSLRKLLAGKRIYALWSPQDPLPFLVFVIRQAVPQLVTSLVRRIASRFKAVAAYPGAGPRKRSLDGRGL